jgi:hypothetical protein
MYSFYVFFLFPSPILEMAAAVISGYKLIIYFSHWNEYVIVEFFFSGTMASHGILSAE